MRSPASGDSNERRYSNGELVRRLLALAWQFRGDCVLSVLCSEAMARSAGMVGSTWTSAISSPGVCWWTGSNELSLYFQANRRHSEAICCVFNLNLTELELTST